MTTAARRLQIEATARDGRGRETVSKVEVEFSKVVYKKEWGDAGARAFE